MMAFTAIMAVDDVDDDDDDDPHRTLVFSSFGNSFSAASGIGASSSRRGRRKRTQCASERRTSLVSQA
jgi:hypothetical protein